MAAFFLALEGALRLFWPHDFPFFAGIFVEDPAVGLRHIPLARSRMASGTSGTVAVRINSRGYRGREYPWNRPAGFRILGLGDSFAFGFGVEEDDTYLARLERALTDRQVEVINAGLAGMGPDNEVRLLAADGQGLRPDLVLLGFFVGNDLMDVLTGPHRTRLSDGAPTLPDGFLERWYRPLRQGRMESRPLARSPTSLRLPIPFKGFLRRNSHAYRFLAGRVGRLRMAWQAPRDRAPAAEFNPFQPEAFCLRAYPPEFDQAWTLTRAALDEMKAWCDAHGSRLAIVAIPTEAQVYPARWAEVRRRYDLREEDFDLEKPQRLLTAFAAERGIPFIDLLPALRTASGTGGPLYFETDIHWTARGHAVAGEEILRRLGDMKLPPGN